MNILFVLDYYKPHVGGIEVLFGTLAEELVRRGHTVTVITQQLPETPCEEVLNGVRIIRIRSPHRYAFWIASIPRVLREARTADIIHTSTFTSAPGAWIASMLSRKPVLLTVHEVWIGNWKRFTQKNALFCSIHSILERLVFLPKYTQYVTVSHSTQKQLLSIGTPQSKITVIHNAVDYTHWNPKKHTRAQARKKWGVKKNFTFAFFGRPGVSKGLPFLIHAFAALQKDFPEAKLVAHVSTSESTLSQRQEIAELIDQFRLSDSVSLLEPVPYNQLPGYFTAADCVVVPSLAEGFGFTAAEASAMNVPVLISNTTSLPEVVSGKHLLAEPGDVESLYRSMKKAIHGKYLSTPRKHFDLNTHTDKYEKLYKQIKSK